MAWVSDWGKRRWFLGGVGGDGGRAIHDHDVPLQSRIGKGARALSGRLGQLVQSLLENPQRQAGLGLAEGAVRGGDLASSFQAEQGLQLADDFAAGGLRIEHRPHKAPKDTSRRVGALAAVGSRVGQCMRHVGQGRTGQSFEAGEGVGARFGQGSAEAVGGELSAKLRQKRLTDRPSGGIYTALLIPSHVFMKNLAVLKPPDIESRYRELVHQLGRTSWISEGYVQDRGPGAGGPKYQWTRKVKGKTVSVALSQEQFEWLRTAIEDWKTLQKLLREMQMGTSKNS